MKVLRNILTVTIPILLIGAAVTLLYRYNYISHRRYTAADFSLPTASIYNDQDKDGVYDLKDVLQSAREYTAKKPDFEVKFYGGDGWPNDGKGFDVDVVNYALRGAGYDMRELIWKDCTLNKDAYEAENTQTENSAFRNSANLKTYFDRHFTKHETELEHPEDWQPGDFVVFSSGHVAVLSDIRNADKFPWMIHHYMRFQAGYEQDALELPDWGEITGHYRLNASAASITEDRKVKVVK